jgi:hypothetical protein
MRPKSDNIRVEIQLTPSQHEALLAEMASRGVKDKADFIRQTLISAYPAIPDDMRGRGQYDRAAAIGEELGRLENDIAGMAREQFQFTEGDPEWWTLRAMIEASERDYDWLSGQDPG